MIFKLSDISGNNLSFNKSNLRFSNLQGSKYLSKEIENLDNYAGVKLELIDQEKE